MDPVETPRRFASTDPVPHGARAAVVRGLAVASLIAFAVACGETEPKDPVPAEVVRYEPSDPDVVLAAHGSEFRRDEVERAAAFFRLAFPEEPPALHYSRAINDELLIIAAQKQYYADVLPTKEQQAWLYHQRLEKGESFRKIMQQIRFRSEPDQQRQVSWHYPRDFGISSMGWPAVELDKGEYSEPFYTKSGIFVVMVEDVLDGGTPQTRKVKLLQIAELYEDRSTLAQTLSDKIVPSIRVDYVHPDYQPYVDARILLR